MTTTTRVFAAALAGAAALALAAPAGADPDIDFANELHSFGIYGPRDYNAWLGKIACKRMARGVDTTAYAAANFIEKNLPQGSTSAQALQFLGAAVNTYCPDQIGVLQNAAQ